MMQVISFQRESECCGDLKGKKKKKSEPFPQEIWADFMKEVAWVLKGSIEFSLAVKEGGQGREESRRKELV